MPEGDDTLGRPWAELRAGQREEQRTQILDAAERMLRTGGAAVLGMRRLAVESGVGHVTPYKLFGSKHGVLWALLLRAVGPRLPELALETSDEPLADALARQDRVFETVATDEPFARELLAALDEVSPPEARQQWIAFSTAFLVQDLRRMQEVGLIRLDAPIDLAIDQFTVALAGAFRRWILRLSSFERFREECRTAILTGLLAFATPAGRERLWPALLSLARARSGHAG